MPSDSHDFKQRWKELLGARGGLTVISRNETQLFSFARESDTAKLIQVWEDALGTRELYLIGYLPSGDLSARIPMANCS